MTACRSSSGDLTSSKPLRFSRFVDAERPARDDKRPQASAHVERQAFELKNIIRWRAIHKRRRCATAIRIMRHARGRRSSGAGNRSTLKCRNGVFKKYDLALKSCISTRTLPARHVIHTVGPLYEGGRSGEAALLRSCSIRQRSAWRSRPGCNRSRFPCISTDVYGYAQRAACDIAVTAVVEWPAAHDLPQVVTFCCYNADEV